MNPVKSRFLAEVSAFVNLKGIPRGFVNSFLEYSQMQFRLSFKKLQWTQNAKSNPKPVLKKVTGSFSSIWCLNSWHRGSRSIYIILSGYCWTIHPSRSCLNRKRKKVEIKEIPKQYFSTQSQVSWKAVLYQKSKLSASMKTLLRMTRLSTQTVAKAPCAWHQLQAKPQKNKQKALQIILKNVLVCMQPPKP